MQFSNLFYYTAELLTFTIALLTMGMFAGERKNGTETLLFTSSRSITGIVIGKFLAGVCVLLITEVISLIYYIILCSFAGGLTNQAETITVLFGFLLLGMTYISIGGFLSSLTENQIIAGVATIVTLLATWFLPNLWSAFSMLSPVSLFQKFPQGMISISDTVRIIIYNTIIYIAYNNCITEKKESKVRG
ncbi:MAG: ABC transporter permease subunit [Clostridia bacterium]|nr:ABC transporter permease subunit [Clostridia bacterium]